MTSTMGSEDSFTLMGTTTSVTGLTGKDLDSENWLTRVAEFTRANGSTVNSWASEDFRGMKSDPIMPTKLEEKFNMKFERYFNMKFEEKFNTIH
jgi:hypothetical protein